MITADSTNDGLLERIGSLLEGDKVPRQRTVVVTRAMKPTPYSVINEEFLSKNGRKTGLGGPVQ